MPKYNVRWSSNANVDFSAPNDYIAKMSANKIGRELGIRPNANKTVVRKPDFKKNETRTVLLEGFPPF